MSAPKYTPEEVGPEIDIFLRNLCVVAGFDLDFTVKPATPSAGDFETPDIMVQFTGQDLDLLLGNKGELLLALEHLTMEAIKLPAEDHSRICFDANDYRVMRVMELRMSAQTAAERVRQTAMPFFFNPMSSRERRLIHLALRDATDLRSESVGTGPTRQVVIVPAGQPTPPQPPPPPRPRFEDRGPRPGGDRDRRGPRDGNRRGPGGGDRRGPRPPRGPFR